MAHDSAPSHRSARSRHTAAAGAGRSTSPPAALPNEPNPRAVRVADGVLAAMGAAPRLDDAASLPIGNAVRLSEIVPDSIRWLSPGRLALGKITVLDGDPGLGKSTLLCEFAARITRGDPLPGGQPSPPRGVILLAAEDDLHDTIRPRIDAAGGDPHRIVTLLSVPDRSAPGRPVALPGDAPILGAVAAHADAALVIIDPLAGFLGPRRGANDPAHVRRILAALREVAERANVAIVVVRHLNKTSAANPMYRGGGSIGIIGSARCGLLLAPDRDDPDRRILAATKENLTAHTPSLAFRLEPVPGSGVARVVWEGESPVSATQLLHDSAANPGVRSALDETRQWLRAALAAGPRPSKTLQEEAAAHGHAHRTLVRARRAEGIVVRKQPGPHGGWTWELPPLPSDPSQSPK